MFGGWELGITLVGHLFPSHTDQHGVDFLFLSVSLASVFPPVWSDRSHRQHAEPRLCEEVCPRFLLWREAEPSFWCVSGNISAFPLHSTAVSLLCSTRELLLARWLTPRSLQSKLITIKSFWCDDSHQTVVNQQYGTLCYKCLILFGFPCENMGFFNLFGKQRK